MGMLEQWLLLKSLLHDQFLRTKPAANGWSEFFFLGKQLGGTENEENEEVGRCKNVSHNHRILNKNLPKLKRNAEESMPEPLGKGEMMVFVKMLSNYVPNC
jgi:hypothetical protein